MAKRIKKSNKKIINKMAAALDDLAEYEEFRNEVLPLLRKELKKGTTPQELQTKYEALLTAREISMAATSDNEAIALAAIKDLRDRTSGKAKERKEIHHHLSAAKDEEIDALLLSEMREIEAIEEKQKKSDD